MLNMQYIILPYRALPPSDKFLSRQGTILRISVTSAASASVATGFYAFRGSSAPPAWPRPLPTALHCDWTAASSFFFPFTLASTLQKAARRALNSACLKYDRCLGFLKLSSSTSFF